MSWFTDIFTGIRDIVSPVVEVAAPVVSAVAPIAGAVISSQANKSAAKTYADASNAATAAQVQANQDAQRRFDAQQAAGAEAQQRLRQVQSLDPNMLTPTQRTRLDDATRDANARLAASGLRGAGRAQAAVIQDTQGRLRGSFFDENQRRADAATSTLAAQGVNATNNLAAIDRSTGQAQSMGLRDVGATDAGLDLAQGRNAGVAIGAIAAQMASERAERGRERRYSTAQTQA